MTGDRSSISEELLKAIADFDAAGFLAAKRARRDRPWVRDMIAVIGPRTGGIDMDERIPASVDADSPRPSSTKP